MPPWKPEPGRDGFLGKRGSTEDRSATIGRTRPEWASECGLPLRPDWTDGWSSARPISWSGCRSRTRSPRDGTGRVPHLRGPIAVKRPLRQGARVPARHARRASRQHASRRDATSRHSTSEIPAGLRRTARATADYPEGYFFGWTPGQLPPVSEDLAWRLNPGTDLVLQLHMQPTGKPERVQPAIGLYFAARRLADTGDAAPRQAEHRHLARSEATTWSPTHTSCRWTSKSTPSSRTPTTARAKCRPATLPDGSTKGLLQIRDWDFDWQDTYRYASRSPSQGHDAQHAICLRQLGEQPAQPATAAAGRALGSAISDDEMGDLWIQVVPRTRGDLDLLVREFRQKVFREDIVGYETVLRRTPDDVGLHDDVALLYLEVGRIDNAISQFTESTRLVPGKAAAHFNLGTALVAAGRMNEAMVRFRKALELDPDYTPSLNNLGSLLAASGQLEEAAACYRRVLEIAPRSAPALNNLGSVLMRLDRAEEALTYLRRALEINPNYPDAE